MEEFSDIGSYIRIPRKLIRLRKEEERCHPVVVEAIAEKLKLSGRNLLPLIVEEMDEDEYEVLFNGHVLEASEKARLDFVWCILADEERRKQIEIEAKQRFEVNILTASEETIAGMLAYIKTIHSGFSQVEPAQAAKVIVEKRNNSWKSLEAITKLHCKIGDKKLKTLTTYFCVGEESQEYLEIEALPHSKVNILTASEDTIAGILLSIKREHSEFSKVDHRQAAKAIVEKRNNSWKSLKPITKLRCKLGDKKLKTLAMYFYVG